MEEESKYFIVVDIGGTNFRIGLFSKIEGSLSDIKRFPTPNLYTHAHLKREQLIELVVDTIIDAINDYIQLYRNQIEGVGISFAGPVDKQGNAKAAPTVFGSGTFFLPIRGIIERAVNIPVGVINDISAAAWRYSDRYSEPFCIITVSSGVGNKVFYGNEVLLNSKGYGGEIGHHTFDFSENALPCDCGGKGHVGAIASGRGVEQLTKRESILDYDSFKESELGILTAANVDNIDSYKIAEAVKKGDLFTTGVLKKSLRALASCISAMYSSIGIEKYVIIGGFAISIGEIYTKLLAEELLTIGCFGLNDKEIKEMVVLGELDDDHCMIGAGIYMLKGRGEG